MTTPASHRCARALHDVINPLHSVAYFAPQVAAAWEKLGLEPVAQGYVAGRAAPMGAVDTATATAVFYNFNPFVISLGVPAAWEIASPAQVVATRGEAIEQVYRDIGAPEDGVAEATDLARQAASGLSCVGRPLAAGNVAVEPPSGAFGALWQALTVLREYRGDGHVALLTAAGLDGVEAIVLASSWSASISKGFYQRTRLWDDDAWDDATGRLAERGLLTADGAMTDEGRAFRDQLEADTDRLDAGPSAALGVAGARRLFDLLTPLVRALSASGIYPRPIPEASWPDDL